MTSEMVVYSPLGCPKLNVRLSDETLWLTMQQLAMVFGVDRSVIGKHIRNIYKTGELDREATWAKIAQVQMEGGRQVNDYCINKLRPFCLLPSYPYPHARGAFFVIPPKRA